MDGTLEIARTNFINKGIMILLLAFCMGLQGVTKAVDGGFPFFMAYIMSALLLMGFVVTTLRQAFKFNKVSKEERKRLFKAHQLHGLKLFACLSLLVLIPFLCVYLLHFNALTALQVGAFITFAIAGTINLWLALRMKYGVRNAK